MNALQKTCFNFLFISRFEKGVNGLFFHTCITLIVELIKLRQFCFSKGDRVTIGSKSIAKMVVWGIKCLNAYISDVFLVC